MTLDQIDLEGNGFHEALNAFIISLTMERRGALKARMLQKTCGYNPPFTIAHCCETLPFMCTFHPDVMLFRDYFYKGL